MTVSQEICPTSAPFFGFMGVTAALCFANIGKLNSHIVFHNCTLYSKVLLMELLKVA